MRVTNEGKTRTQWHETNEDREGRWNPSDSVSLIEVKNRTYLTSPTCNEMMEEGTGEAGRRGEERTRETEE